MNDPTPAGLPPAGEPGGLHGTAAAKVNLGLAVTGTRPDGYHTLVSLFLRLDLADALAVVPGLAGDPDTLTIGGDPDCPVEGNLVLRAVAALRAALPDGPSLPGLAFTLVKRIPMGGGLAGGSTDAATALRLALRAWSRGMDPAALSVLAARLGADVSFFVARHAAALITGIGERIDPLPALRSRVGVLLMTPAYGMATPAVFAAFDRLPPPSPAAVAAAARLAARWRAGLEGADLAADAVVLRGANDLWPAVALLVPRMVRLRAVLEATLGRPVLLTGSGSTLVALYPSPDAARAAADRIIPGEDPELAGIRVTATRDGHPQDEEPLP